MLTPTGGVTFAQYWDAIKAGNITHVRFTFLGQNIVLDESDVLVDSGVVVNDVFNGETDLVFGRALSKQVTVTFINSSKLSSLNWTGEFTLEFGVEISGATNWVTIGYFTGEKPKNVTTVQTIQFTAYDRMIRFETLADEFLKSLTYPKTIQEIYTALCTYVGLQKEAGSELPNIMSRSYASAPADMQGYTCRDLLGFIAEACGCYAKINSAGNVQMKWFTDNTSYAITATEEFNVESGDIHDGFTWDEADTYTWDEFDNFTWDDVCGYQEALRVDGIYVKQLSSDFDIYYPTETVDNVYCIFENPFLSVSTASDITAYVAPIYDRLYAFGGYLPVRIECIGNWCVEAGDIITVDVNNLTVSFPIFVKEMAWNGSVADVYDTTANNKRQVYASEATKQRVMTSNKIEMYVSDNYYKKRSGISIDEDGVEITGDKHIHLQADANQQWRIDSQGLSLYNSTRDSNAMQFGGQFDAQRLTAEAGVYAYNPGGDTTHGRLAFVAVDLANKYYSFYVFEYSYPGVPVLRPWYNLGMDLGTSSYKINNIHAGSIYAEGICSPTAFGVDIYPSSGITSRKFSFWDYQGGGFQVRGESLSGDTWNIVNVTYYGQVVSPSSRNVKHNIRGIKTIGDIIDKLVPVEFVYNDDKQDKKHFGLIYEDTVGLLPEICEETRTKEGKAEKAINYAELVPVLLKEIQDLRKRVAELEKEVRG